MPVFTFEIQEHLKRRAFVTVEADNEEYAMEKARQGMEYKKEIRPGTEEINDVYVTCVIEDPS